MGTGASAGQIGGIFAGAVALLGCIGAGIRWWLGWKERRAATLHAKLLVWEAKLEEREKRADAESAEQYRQLAARVGQMEKQQGALLAAYQLTAGALRAIDPGNMALGRADELLRSAFPLYPFLPAQMASLLRSIDETAGGKS